MGGALVISEYGISVQLYPLYIAPASPIYPDPIDVSMLPILSVKNLSLFTVSVSKSITTTNAVYEPEESPDYVFDND